MNILHTSLDILLPLVAILFFFLFYPFYLLIKLVIFLYKQFLSENVAGKVVLITGASSGIGEVSYFSLLDVNSLINTKCYYSLSYSRSQQLLDAMLFYPCLILFCLCLTYVELLLFLIYVIFTQKPFYEQFQVISDQQILILRFCSIYTV